MATKQQIVEYIYTQLGEPSDSSNYTTARVEQVMNSYINRICKKLVINPVNQQKFQAGDLPFLQKQQWYTSLQKISLGDTLETTDTVATLDTTNLPDSGSLRVAGDIITYTAKTATTVTGVTGVDVQHQSGDTVYPLKPLPTGITKPFTVYIVDSKGMKQEIPSIDDRYPSGASVFYSVVIGSDGTEYFLFNNISSNDKVLVYYYSTPTDLVANDDVCVIPDPYALEILPRLVAGQLFRDTEEYEDAQSKLGAGFSALQEMYDFYNRRVEGNRLQVKVRQTDFTSVRGTYGKRRRNTIR